jgi:hypothetical protein
MAECRPDPDPRDAIPKVDARIALGGRFHPHKSKYPGVLEEAVLTLRAKQPLYLVGAFGGCTGAIIEAVRGGAPSKITLADQTAQGDWGREYAALTEKYAADPGESPVEYGDMTAELAANGVAGLNNGLSEAENLELFESHDFDRIVTLLTAGLRTTLGVASV